jgi:hypothetical protein
MFGIVEVDAQGPLGVQSAGEARYPADKPMSHPERTVASPFRDTPWPSIGVENVAPGWAATGLTVSPGQDLDPHQRLDSSEVDSVVVQVRGLV